MKLSIESPETLKDWGVYLINAIKKVCGGKAEQPLFGNLVLDIENSLLNAYKKNSIAKMKRIIKETELWALELDPNDSSEINKIMFDKFGKRVGEDNFFSKANSIINRGAIKNLIEYRILTELLDLYAGDISKKELLDSISELVFAFERNHNR